MCSPPYHRRRIVQNNREIARAPHELTTQFNTLRLISASSFPAHPRSKPSDSPALLSARSHFDVTADLRTHRRPDRPPPHGQGSSTIASYPGTFIRATSFSLPRRQVGLSHGWRIRSGESTKKAPDLLGCINDGCRRAHDPFRQERRAARPAVSG